MEFRQWLENEEAGGDEGYWVATADLPVMDKKLEKLNRRATKLGMPPVTMEVGEKKFVKENDRGGGKTMSHIRLLGTAPKLKGWTFVARIVHGEHGNMMMSVPGEELPTKYRTAPPACDHCRTNRSRKDTFVVRNDSGEHKQIGTNCLRDFLGTDDPAAYVLYFSELKSLMDDMDRDEMGGGGRGSREIETVNFVQAALAVIRISGFVSRKAAEERGGGHTTSDALNDYFFGTSKESVAFQKQVDEAMRPDDREKAQSMVDWASSLKDAGEDKVDGDYLWNLSVAASNSRVNSRSMGIMASLPSAYERAMGKLKPREARPELPAPTLKAGDKFEGELTVEKVRSWETDYGVTTLHIMKDASGQTYKWKASRESLDEGSRVKIKGSVKSVGPDKYEGGAITVELTRCKVLGVVVSDDDKGLIARKAELEKEWREYMGNLEPFYRDRPLSDGEVERYTKEYAAPTAIVSSPESKQILNHVLQVIISSGDTRYWGSNYDEFVKKFLSHVSGSSFQSAVSNLMNAYNMDDHPDLHAELKAFRESQPMVPPDLIARMKEVARDLWKIHAAEARYGSRGV
jgi:hypothetical protein